MDRNFAVFCVVVVLRVAGSRLPREERSSAARLRNVLQEAVEGRAHHTRHLLHRNVGDRQRQAGWRLWNCGIVESAINQCGIAGVIDHN